MKKLLFIFFLLLIFSSTSFAKYRQVCLAQYMTQNGWSKKYEVEVSFMTGTELNEATSSIRYSSLSLYAVIFWDKEQATVIKLSSFTTCGSEATKSCVTSIFGDLKGKDQDDDEWKICKDQFCF